MPASVEEIKEYLEGYDDQNTLLVLNLLIVKTKSV